MKKVKADGYRINGVFCEINQPMLCSMVGLEKFEKKYMKYQYRETTRIPVPNIKDSGSLYFLEYPLGRKGIEHTFEYFDEDYGLIYQFYEDDSVARVVFVLIETDLKCFFEDYFYFNYYEQDRIPSSRFIENLLKYTKFKDMDSFVKKLNEVGKEIRNDPNYDGNLDWDGTLDENYVARLLKKSPTSEKG
jgi:hypothetical protein